jgi:chorismate mutase
MNHTTPIAPGDAGVDLTLAPLFARHAAPLVIAGPRVVTTEDELVASARALAALGRVSALRAGLWRPRPRPHRFEGVGAIGLSWLARARAETGLRTAVEVASPHHAEQCLAHGVDALCVGARTVANPASVQEIASALRGADVAVLVTNPTHADLALWVGALERLNHAGVTRLAAVFQGFSPRGRSSGAADGAAAIELRRMLPALPVLCDATARAGGGGAALPAAQEAMNLGMAGLVFASQRDPAEAGGDPRAITPQALGALLDALVLRDPSAREASVIDTLAALRRQIDALDAELLATLAARMAVVTAIGEHKVAHNLTALQLDRWSALLRDRVAAGRRLDLDEGFVGALFQLVHAASLARQTVRMGRPDDGPVDVAAEGDTKRG